MRLALELAERGRGAVGTNPLVGCVIVNDGRIVGEGWHERIGGAHAEAMALDAARGDTHGATAYVTLEPCDHHGRTPPCTAALIDAGVARVVVASLDPNPLVNGRGIARLKAANIAVSVGLLEAAAEAQNSVYGTNQLLGRPYVLYKYAASLDGKTALTSGPARWLTGPESRARTHVWRGQYDAVAVGVNTVLIDDPALTTRDAPGPTPVKVVFDSTARTPSTAKLFERDSSGEPARVVIVTTAAASATARAALHAKGAELLTVSTNRHGRPCVGEALRALLKRGVTKLLLEGGGTLAWEFLATGSVDAVACFVAPKLLGGASSTPLGGPGVGSIGDAFELEQMTIERVGADLLISGEVRYPSADQGGVASGAVVGGAAVSSAAAVSDAPSAAHSSAVAHCESEA